MVVAWSRVGAAGTERSGQVQCYVWSNWMKVHLKNNVISTAREPSGGGVQERESLPGMTLELSFKMKKSLQDRWREMEKVSKKNKYSARSFQGMECPFALGE